MKYPIRIYTNVSEELNKYLREKSESKGKKVSEYMRDLLLKDKKNN